MLCEGLARRGHEVTALTAVPHYPSGRIPEEFRGSRVRRGDENGVHVIRVPLPSVDRSKLASRLYQFLAFQVNATLAARDITCDVFLTHSPALEVWLPFVLFSSLRRKPAIYSVHDVYPYVGIRSGIFRNGGVIRLVAALERTCLKRANQVRILSKSFIPQLKEMGVAEAGMTLLYDWVDVDAIKPMCRDNSFAIENRLGDSFRVLYSGNLGHIQGLDSVLDTARLLADHPEICVLVVGDGSRRVELQEKARKLNLQNVRFIPYQPRERVPEVYATADVSLISLRKGTATWNLPSKVYSIMASGRPVLASVDEGSDTWDLIQRSQSGMCVPADSPEELAKAILFLKENPGLRKDFSEHAREYVTKFHSPEIAAEQFERLFAEVAECNHR